MTELTPNPPTCRATTKSGNPCRVTLNLGLTGYCVMHDPERIEQAQAMRQQAGQSSGRARQAAKAALPDGVPRAPKTLEDAERMASWLTRAVAIGDINPKVAHEVAVALREFRGIAEKRIMQEEIRSLRRRVTEYEKRLPKAS